MKATVVIAEPQMSMLHSQVLGVVSSALERNGHPVTVVDLVKSHFDPVMTPYERRAYMTDHPVVNLDVARAAEILASSEVLLFLYHTALGTIPVRMKGWLERVMVPGVAFTIEDAKLHPALRQIRHVFGIATYDETWWQVRRGRDAGRRTITRALRVNTGPRTRTHWLAMYGADAASHEEVAAFVAHVEHRLGQL